MKLIIFLAVFIILADWGQITLYVIMLLKPSVKKTKLKNKKYLKLIEDKTGLKLDHIIVIQSDKMHGGMSGIPEKPVMFLSSALLENLNDDEMQYVLLHEAGHFKYHHPIIVVITQLILIITGIYLLQFTESIPLSLIIGIFLAFIYIKVARLSERQAENFAALNMDNPKSMISAVDKFEKAWSGVRFPKLKKLFSWNISYSEKRQIARKYI